MVRLLGRPCSLADVPVLQRPEAVAALRTGGAHAGLLPGAELAQPTAQLGDFVRVIRGPILRSLRIGSEIVELATDFGTRFGCEAIPVRDEFPAAEVDGGMRVGILMKVGKPWPLRQAGLAGERW